MIHATCSTSIMSINQSCNGKHLKWIKKYKIKLKKNNLSTSIYFFMQDERDKTPH
jgi:hypothetical protein